VTATVIIAGIVILIATEKFKKVRAERRKLEQDAEFSVIDSNDETWIRETNKRATYVNLTGTPLLKVNGREQQPTDFEIALHKYRLAIQNSPRMAESIQEPVIIEQKQDLMRILNQARYGIIVGAQDAGKTTILKHLITARLSTSHILVIDPHSSPDKWPADCNVIGSGRDFKKINNALNSLMLLMSQRYREIAKGEQEEEGHERITVIFDEWMPITEQLGKDAEQIIRSLLSESRKVNIHMFLGSHSERVGPLGIKGAGDLKKGLVMVRLTVNPITKARSGTVDWGDGEIGAELPGPYEQLIKANVLLPEIAPNHCAVCGIEASGMYCGNACKQKAYRERNR
jgi:hypothetical protein